MLKDVTRYADRKAKIRAYQAAHPGMTYRQAARQFEAENQLVLPLPDLEEARALAMATHDAYEAMIKAPAGSSRAQRRALEHAFRVAQDNEDSLYLGEDPYAEDDLVLRTAFILLTRAASAGSGGGALARVAASILDGLALGSTADVIRGMEFRPAIPPPASTASARHARAAAEALLAAAAIPSRDDGDWVTCQGLIRDTRKMAHAAADADTPPTGK